MKTVGIIVVLLIITGLGYWYFTKPNVNSNSSNSNSSNSNSNKSQSGTGGTNNNNAGAGTAAAKPAASGADPKLQTFITDWIANPTGTTWLTQTFGSLGVAQQTLLNGAFANVYGTGNPPSDYSDYNFNNYVPLVYKYGGTIVGTPNPTNGNQEAQLAADVINGL